jgi:plasmid stabilization system protein ParE
MHLLITPLAAFDLEEIGDSIAQDNPVAWLTAKSNHL